MDNIFSNSNSNSITDLDALFSSLDSEFDKLQSEISGTASAEKTENLTQAVAAPEAAVAPFDEAPAIDEAPVVSEISEAAPAVAEFPPVETVPVTNTDNDIFSVSFDEQTPFNSETPVKQVEEAAPAFVPVKEPVVEEPQSALAKGLPAWSIEPPMVVARRKK